MPGPYDRVHHGALFHARNPRLAVDGQFLVAQRVGAVETLPLLARVSFDFQHALALDRAFKLGEHGRHLHERTTGRRPRVVVVVEEYRLDPPPLPLLEHGAAVACVAEAPVETREQNDVPLGEPGVESNRGEPLKELLPIRAHRKVEKHTVVAVGVDPHVVPLRVTTYAPSLVEVRSALPTTGPPFMVGQRVDRLLIFEPSSHLVERRRDA